jgi:hypothetical protein
MLENQTLQYTDTAVLSHPPNHTPNRFNAFGTTREPATLLQRRFTNASACAQHQGQSRTLHLWGQVKRWLSWHHREQEMLLRQLKQGKEKEMR